MTVGAIGNSALLDPSQTADATSWQTRMQQALGPVAQLFGESSQQLMSDLQSGKTSLSALASAKGISQTDLANAIKQGLQQSSAGGGPALSDSQLTNLANTIANRVHGGHHHHGGGGMSAIGGTSGTSAAGLAGVGIDSDGDNDGSGSGSTGTTGTTGTSTSAIQSDVQRLMFDLQTMLQSSSSTSGTSSTTAANSASTWSNASSTNLLTQLSQFDQTL